MIVSPNGVMFVKHEIRKGLLGKMLQELLDTRVMVKKSMKDYKDDSVCISYYHAKTLLPTLYRAYYEYLMQNS